MTHLNVTIGFIAASTVLWRVGFLGGATAVTCLLVGIVTYCLVPEPPKKK